MELVFNLVFAWFTLLAVLIIGGVIAAEIWAAWESRNYRRRREEEAEREIPEDPRERMVPKSWRKK